MYRGAHSPFVAAGNLEALRENTGGNIPWLHARRTVVIDDQPGKEYNSDEITMIQFSKDEHHYCYAVYGTDQKRALVVIDGKESGSYEALSGLKFASDEKSASFLTRDSSRLLRVTYSF